MTPRRNLRLCVCCAALIAAAPVERRDQGNLVLENILATPPALAERLRAWDNIRTAGFQDWLADGSMLITTRFAATTQVHRVTAPGGARTQLTFFDEPVAQALARPGHPGQFALRRDAGGGEYFQIDLATTTGADAPITPLATRNQSMVFSSDGAKLVWSSVPRGTADYALWLADPDTPGSAHAIFQGQGEIDPLAVTPDGRTLLFERVEIGNVAQKLFLLDLAGKTVTPLLPRPQMIDYDLAFGAPQFTPDGKSLILGTNAGGEFKRLMRLDLATSTLVPLTGSIPWDTEGFSLSPDGKSLAYAINEDGVSRIFLRDMPSGRTIRIEGLPAGSLSNLRFSPDGARLAINLSSATTPLDVWTYAPTPSKQAGDSASARTGEPASAQAGDQTGNAGLNAQGRLDRWTDSELGGIDPKTLVAPTLIHYPSFDGRLIPAFVYIPATPATPATAAPDGKRPVIISIHGGPEGQTRPSFWPTNQVWLQTLGAVIIAPNIRGSDGYGRSYLALDNGMKRQDAVADIGALLDWIGKQPDLDASRVVVTGGSYGGFMTLSAFAAYGDRLAGAYDIVGISNLVSFLQHTEPYRRDLRRAEYGDERDPAMHDFMERTAPLNNTAKMTKPLFVVAGLNDPRVPYTEGEQMIAKIRAQGGDVWYMLAKDEGHGFRRQPNRDAQRAAEVLWFEKVFGENGKK